MQLNGSYGALKTFFSATTSSLLSFIVASFHRCVASECCVHIVLNSIQLSKIPTQWENTNINNIQIHRIIINTKDITEITINITITIIIIIIIKLEEAAWENVQK